MKIYRYQCLWESTESHFRDTVKMVEKFSTDKEEVEKFGLHHMREVVGEEAWKNLDYDSFYLEDLVDIQLEISKDFKYEQPIFWVYDTIEL